MRKTRSLLLNPVLASRDGTWNLSTLYWKQMGVRHDKRGYYRSGARWYLRGQPGLSFKSEAEARDYKNPLDTPVAPRIKYDPSYDQTSVW